MPPRSGQALRGRHIRCVDFDGCARGTGVCQVHRCRGPDHLRADQQRRCRRPHQQWPHQPKDGIAHGKLNHERVIIGTNANEGSYFIAGGALAAGRPLTIADYHAMIAATVPTQPESAHPVGSLWRPCRRSRRAVRRQLLHLPKRGAVGGTRVADTVWRYEFGQPNPALAVALPMAPGVDLLASRTTELTSVFGRASFGRPVQEQDARLSNEVEVISYWTGFAAVGKSQRRQTAAKAPRWWSSRRAGPEPTPIGLASCRFESMNFNADHHCDLWNSLGYPAKLISSVPAHSAGYRTTNNSSLSRFCTTLPDRQDHVPNQTNERIPKQVTCLGNH